MRLTRRFNFVKWQYHKFLNSTNMPKWFNDEIKCQYRGVRIFRI